MIGIFRGENHFLSNFYPCVITHDGIRYPSVEHYYIALKTNNKIVKFNNKEYKLKDFRLMVSNLDNPGLAKKVGKEIIARKDWDEYRMLVLKDGITEKFKDPVLRKKLIDTGSQELVEGNWWHDNNFGSCFCDKCKDKKGKNKLGKIIMKVRDEITGNGKRGLEEIFFK